MIFSLGKARSGERPVESQTLERWRNMAVSQDDEFESVRIIDGGRSNEGVISLTETGPSASEEEKPFTFDLGEESTVRPAPRAQFKVEEHEPEIKKPATILPFASRTPAPEKVSLDEDLRRRFGANLRSALGPGTVIEGKFSFDSPVRIDGSLTGEVISTSALIVGEQAVVSGKVRVGSIIIAGEVSGEIEASDLVEIRAGGRYEGPISAARIVIEDGGIFNGTCRMY